MTAYEIKYNYEGKEYITVEMPTKGWEMNFLKQVLNRIESITMAGAVVTGLNEVKQ